MIRSDFGINGLRNFKLFSMTLKSTDFELSQDQLDAINQHFMKKASAYRLENEDGPTSIKVVFEWVPGEGRFVTAHYDGEVKGCEVENGLYP